ncbi:AIM24 family protein [Williamsia sp. CHRR-6]|uniref:AIM24 family protein n=1 Tax=Williamsia sp. CHRR-6 TaxID=2835871 RepID=UPI001BDA6FD3|nr:AIM24 family protein [Williamsia sp. CHRR-6]MBT0567197.1 AIM24 family protein [Williamsia sp. CHRR-6]
MVFEKVNSKVVKVDIGRAGGVVARKGAMLFYTGAITFAPHGMPGGGAGMGAIGGIAGRMMAGEHERTMLAQGMGEVHYGFRGLAVHVVDMPQGGTLMADASRLLGHTAGLQSSVVSVQAQGGGGGGGLRGALRGAATGVLTGNGLMTTQLQGAGAVVLLAHGEVMELRVGQHPVVVDPQAFVGTWGNVAVQMKSALSWRDAVGRGSGEAMQLHCTGDGIVFVQASEQKL